MKKHKHTQECRKIYDSYKKIEVIGDLPIDIIPDPPPANKIDNYGLPKHERKFKPMQLPPVGFEKDKSGDIIATYFKGLSEEEELELLKKIHKYRTEGYWFYNGDNLEYITGNHWYYLNFCHIPVVIKEGRKRKRVSGHPFWVDSDRNFFLHWEQCVEMPFAFGMVYVSSRRSGKTYKSISLMLNQATMTEDAACGIQAQTENMAKSIFKRLKRIHDRLPRHEYLYPQYDTMRHTSGLYFEQAAQKKSKGLMMMQSESLGSWIEPRATTETAFDSEGMFIIYKDEVSKMDKLDINKSYAKDKETCADGPNAIGKILATTTAENIGGKTLEEFQRFYNKSKYDPTLQLSPSQTGVVAYFQSALYGYRHDPTDGEVSDALADATIDEWGYSNTEAARRVIMTLRKGKKGSDLAEIIRKYPITEAEAFTYGESQSPLPLEKIQEQRMFNHDYFQITNPLKTGTLISDISGGLPRAKFIEKDGGLLTINPRLSEEDLNQIIRGVGGYGPARTMCSIGVDPFDHKTTEERDFSKAAAVVICKDPKYFTHPCVVAVYHGRPADPKIFYQDMVNLCIYFSAKAYIENQKPGCVNHFADEGYRGFLGEDVFKPDSKTLGISMRDPKKRNFLVDRLIGYVGENVGKLTTPDGTYYSEHYFDRLLEDWYGFSPDDIAWTKFDLSVATLLALMGLEKPHYRPPELSVNDLFW